MSKIKTFIHSFIQSVSNPAYYGKILKVKSSFSWKYFAFLNFLLALVASVQVGVVLYNFNPKMIADEVSQVYPADLVVNVEGGRVDINKPLPYKVGFPRKWGSEFNSFALVTFESDENVQGIRDFLKRDSLAMVTESTIYMLKDTDTREVRVYPVPMMDEKVTLNKRLIDSYVDEVMNIGFIKNKMYVPTLMSLVLLFGFVVMFTGRLIVLAIYSFFVWLIAPIFIKSERLNYGSYLKVSFHSITLIMVVAYLLSWLKITVLVGPSHLLAFLAWTLFVLSKASKEVVVKKKVVKKRKTTPTKRRTTKKK